MADIVVTTDFSQVKDLNNTLNSTGDIFNKVVDRLLREQRRAERVTKAFSETTEASLDLLAKAEAIVTQILEAQAAKREKARQKEAERAEKEVQRQIEANNKLIASEVKRRAKEEEVARTSAQNFQAQVGPNLGLGARGISAGASADAFEAQIERLRQKYDKVYASSQLYESSLKELNQAHMLGAINTKQHETAVESLNAEYQAFQNGTATASNRFTNQIQQTGQGLNSAGVIMQQVGYQAGDFIVQVQSGTNAFVAFGQQATQLVGFLPMLAAEAGVAKVAFMGLNISMATLTLGLSIIIPLLTAAGALWMRTGEDSKKAAKGVNDLGEQLKSLDQSLAEYAATKDALEQGLTLDQVISGKGLAQAQQDLQDYKTSLGTLRKAIVDALLGGFGFGEDITATLAALDAEVAKAEERQLAVRRRILDTYQEERASLGDTFALEMERLKSSENSLAYKELQAQIDRRAYENSLRSLGLDAAHIETLLKQYETQRDALKTQESQLVVAENQRASDNARAKERLANEQAYQAALDKTLAKNQYWSDQAKAAERQAAAVDYIVNNLSLLAAKKDAEGFNKAMEDALAAGTQFSLVDLSSIVAMAARNGWDLAAALTAAYNVAASRNPVGASVLIGAGGRPDINPNDMQFRGPVQEAQANILQYNRDKIEEAKKGGGKGTEDALAKLREQLILENELLGVSEAQKRVIQALGDQRSKYSETELNAITAEVEAYNLKLEALKQQEQLAKTMQSSMETAFMSIVEGTESAKDAFKKMAYEIIKELYRVLVVQRMVGQFKSGGGGILGALAGGFGVLTGPSTGSLGLPFGRESGGSIMAGKPYLVGERGPELVIPRHSGTVVNANQTASAATGNNGVTVQNNITVTGSDAAMVRAEVAKMIPQITNATKAAVIDARLRGGQMKAAFG